MNKNQKMLLAFTLIVFGGVLVYKFTLGNKPEEGEIPEDKKNDVPTENKNVEVGKKTIENIFNTTKEYTVNTTKDPLNLRSKANAGSSKIGSLPKGSKFIGQPYSADKSWVVVLNTNTVNNNPLLPIPVKGYVSAAYVI
jgi:hypothetical protein